MPRETPRPVYLPNTPHFIFNNGDSELRLSLPSTLWEYTVQATGGSIEADSGRRAAFVLRRDELITFTLRFFESEWVSVQQFIDFVQNGKPFIWVPDQLDESVAYYVQLQDPAVGSKYAASPDPNYPLVQLLTITLMKGAVANVTPPQSDAILKPRPVWMDSFSLGQIQTIGWVMDEADLPAEPILVPDDDLHNPFLSTDSAQSGINQYGVGGRYAWTNLHEYVRATTQSDYSLGFRFPQTSWQYNRTGGRTGRGSVTSKTDDLLGAPSGHWIGIEFREVDSSERAKRGADGVIGLNLHGIVPPEGDLNVLSFVALFVVEWSVMPLLDFSAIPHVVVGITSDYRLVMKRFDMSGGASFEQPYQTGTWVTLAESLDPVVPANGFFAIEAGMYLASRNGLTGTNINDGFIFARVFVDGSTRGTEVIFRDNIYNRGFGQYIYGMAFGSDVRGAAGDGAGNVSRGVAGIEFDSVLAADNGGSVKRHLYGTLVDGILPASLGPLQQSTQPFGGNRLSNVSRKLNEHDDAIPHNYYMEDDRDDFILPAVIPEANDIVCVGLARWFTGSNPPGTAYSGQGKVIFTLDGASVSAHQQEPGPRLAQGITGISNIMDVIEVNPSTHSKFTPESIEGSLLSWQNDKVGPYSGNTRLMQLALEYAYRLEDVVETEHPPYPPIVNFGWVWDSPDHHTIRVQDTSNDRDGEIVGTLWDWGDDTTTHISGPDGPVNGPRNHTYATPGSKTITLRVIDNDGLISSISETIVIPNTLPAANFSITANPDDPSGLTIDFTDLSTDPDGVIVGWDWDFGDGSPHSHVQNPTHTYDEAGTPSVTLIVTDSGGGTATLPLEITIPIVPLGGDCAEFIDDIPGVSIQGDDFAGGNPPLPAYASTDAFDQYYYGFQFREVYDNAYDYSSHFSHVLDFDRTFNGHPTLKMFIGPASGAHSQYIGAGWDSVPTDDGSPDETYYTHGPKRFWRRIRFAADAGFTQPTSALGEGDQFEGTTITELNSSMTDAAFMNRNGRIYLDLQSKEVFDGPYITTTYDLGPETDFIGRGDDKFGELGILYEATIPTDPSDPGSIRVRVWIGEACMLDGEPATWDFTKVACGRTAFSGPQFFPQISYIYNFNLTYTASPTWTVKNLWVAGHQMADADIQENPFNYSLV